MPASRQNRNALQGWPRWSSVSRHILLGTLLEITLVSALLVWVGASWWLAAAAALAVMVAVRMLVALSSFVVARWFRSVPDGYPTLQPARWIGMLARELAAFVSLFFVYHPWEALINRHDPPICRPDQIPVVFVHGFFSNAGFWRCCKRFLQDRGITALYTLNLEPEFNDMDVYAGQLARRIEEVCALSRRDRVVLVGHSMGGLVCRAYVRSHGSDRVCKIVTLGSPHHGTVLARLVPGPNLRQMRPGSAWLRRLNAEFTKVPTSVYASAHDNIIAPQDSALLDGAEQTLVSGIGHLSMAFSVDTLEWLCAQLPHDSEYT